VFHDHFKRRFDVFHAILGRCISFWSVWHELSLAQGRIKMQCKSADRFLPSLIDKQVPKRAEPKEGQNAFQKVLSSSDHE
jgi:hypothetical protein